VVFGYCFLVVVSQIWGGQLLFYMQKLALARLAQFLGFLETGNCLLETEQKTVPFENSLVSKNRFLKN
jgi:hypothetical protein